MKTILTILLIAFSLSVAGQSSLLTGLSAYYKLNETTGSTIYDSHTNAINGTVTGATINQTGKLGQAVSFDGTGDYITLSDVSQLQIGSSSFTFAGWVYLTSYPSAGSHKTIIGGENDAAGLVVNSDGKLSVAKIYNTEYGLSAGIISLNTWTFVAVTYNPATPLLTFRVGTTVNTGNNTISFNGTASSLYIGRNNVNNDGYLWTGLIDEVGIWKRDLTSDELTTLYNSESALTYPFTVIPSSYSPVAGRDVRFKHDGIEVKDKADPTGFVYWKAATKQAAAITYTIYDSWDFENEDLGFYSDAEVNEDFDVRSLYSHSSANIAEDVINSEITKVLRVTHIGGQLSGGFDCEAVLSQPHDEIYLSYNVKFSNEFNSTAGGKLPGLNGGPVIQALVCPDDDEGFVAVHMFKYFGRLITFNYDRTPAYYPSYCPYASEDYDYDSIYFNNGTWYSVTERIVMNTFTGGVANADGIRETWVDGRLIFQETGRKFMVTDGVGYKIDLIHIANWYGGNNSDYYPATTCYTYFDNFKTWIPNGDPTVGTNTAHDADYVIPTPDEITDKRFYYDQLITSAGTLHNAQYGSSYSPCIDEAYLIDAGAGNTVSYTASWTIGGYDALLFYDGNTTDSRLIRIVEGYDNSSSQTITSTGRYLFVRFSSNTDGGTTGFTGTLTFN